ncbi:MAG: ATPase, T2SS/T4P/T4SS family [Candidatus Nanohaloarchaea archaeon]
MSVRDKDVFDYEYDDETGSIDVNMLGSIYGASIEDYPEVMSRVINILQEVPDASSVVLSESRDYEYSGEQVELLREMAQAIRDISSQGYLSQTKTGKCESFYSEHLPEVQRVVVDQLRKDPVGAYVELKRKERHLEQQRKNAYSQEKRCIKYFIQDVIKPVKNRLEECRMIKRAVDQDYITGHHVGDREVYREFFHPLVRPNFMLTKFMSLPPERGEEISRYNSQEDVEVSIYDVPDQVQPVYHVDPPEFNLPEEKYRLLDAARRFLASHQPDSGEFARPDRMRQVFQNIGKDMIRDIADQMDIQLSGQELDELTAILNRYTSGLGVLELLLSDPKIEDVYINSPIGNSPIYVTHQDYEECETNLIPTKEEAESWATRFRIQSGRPLDEANPVLDTDTEVPGGRARVAIIQENLSPDGLAFAFRRHRSRAWTLPLFIQEDMINPLGAGLLSFIVDGNRSVLFAGTRGAGKTSLLSASMLEILKKHRIVTVEDSVTGDSPIIYKQKGEVRYGRIDELIDPIITEHGREEGSREILRWNPEQIEVLSMDEQGELQWSDVSLFMRHDVEKPVYEVETRTGRKIKVTEDHSLFGPGENSVISEIKPTELSPGDHIATPRELDVPSEEKKWDLTEKASELQGYFVGDMPLNSKRDRLKQIAEDHGYSEHTVKYWIREGIVPAKVFEEVGIDVDAENLWYKHKRQSSRLPAKIELDEKFMEFLGLWMADGCYDSRSVLVTVSDEKCRSVVRQVFRRFDLPVKNHSDGHTLLANSQPLKEVMTVFGFEGDAYTKRVPEWMYSGLNHQRHGFLRGLYSGDGYATEHEAGIDMVNEKLVEDIQTLLLIDGIRGRARDSGNMRAMRISDLEGLKKFKQKIGYLQDYKNDKLVVEGKESTHDTTDIIPLTRGLMEKICQKHDLNSNDYVERGNKLGRQKLKQVVEREQETGIVDKLETLSKSDIFWDQVKSVEKVSENERVYDVSVPGDQNFVTGNILAHNTLELPVNQMKDLGYNIESMKSRSVITQVENELKAEEAIRTSLRLGDSALVIGEVRSDEAKTLYEAMRVGAVANFVGGTIHGEDAYSVFDRVVNDLGVQRTSFKATDIIVSVNKIKSPDGLETYRRVTGITEVRKEWTDDPQEEGAFVDLMRYDSNKDELVPTDELLNGESIILNRIAENIKEWKNNWEAVWDNIQLRKDIKEALVEKAEETGNDNLLEAEFVVKANQRFHLLSQRVQEEYGEQDTERVLARWKEWLDQQV